MSWWPNGGRRELDHEARGPTTPTPTPVLPSWDQVLAALYVAPRIRSSIFHPLRHISEESPPLPMSGRTMADMLRVPLRVPAYAGPTLATLLS